ncbi:MAG: hypothetical protein EAZ30_01085 [Betaproteobacteria bacterium]|nr:MAG: hypothetical protein EAZ30_01085 [Betaproteobacteria bacterium]
MPLWFDRLTTNGEKGLNANGGNRMGGRFFFCRYVSTGSPRTEKGLTTNGGTGSPRTGKGLNANGETGWVGGLLLPLWFDGLTTNGKRAHYERGNGLTANGERAHFERGKQDGWRVLLLPLWFDGLTTNGKRGLTANRRTGSPRTRRQAHRGWR